MNAIDFKLPDLNYNSDKELWGTVTLRYPGMFNIIRARKRVIDEGDVEGGEVISDLYDLKSS